MYSDFKKFSNKWLKDNSISNESIDGWLLGEHNENSIKTICIKENSIKKPPYHVYFRYKTIYDQSDSSINSNKRGSLKANLLQERNSENSSDKSSDQGSNTK